MSKKDPPDKKLDIQIIERHDPTEDAVTDGDPAFEVRLDESTKDPSKHYVLVSTHPDHRLDFTRSYKARGYHEVKYGDGPKWESGAIGPSGETMTYMDHVLMACDRATHEKREARQREFGKNTRDKMTSEKRLTGDVFVKGRGSDRGGVLQPHRG